jgi:uncharacterized protein (TIGR00255 family)
MTGFGAASREDAGLVARVEVRSVNHRHLAVKVRLPHGLATLEAPVEAALRARLARGSVTLTAEVEPAGGAQTQLLDGSRAARLLEELKALAATAGLAAPRVEAVLEAPGVLAEGTVTPAPEAAQPVLLAAVEAAVDELVAARSREGEALTRDLEAHLAEVERLAGAAGERMPEVQARHAAQLQQRVQQLVGEAVTVSASDLAREVAVLADRLDVAEELTRLAAHVSHARELLASSEPSGRSLDFLAQEFNREANTLGSKCNDASVAHLVVELKGVIERLREQAQNLE